MEQPRLNEVSAEKLREKLTDLFGSEEFTIEDLEGGTNNQLKKVRTREGKIYVSMISIRRCIRL